VPIFKEEVRLKRIALNGNNKRTKQLRKATEVAAEEDKAADEQLNEEEEKLQPKTELIKEIKKVVEEEPKKTSTKGSKSISNVI
jgi:hypothetical protein